jgi:HEPN domain-containing protein
MTSVELIKYWKDGAIDSLDTSNTLFIPGKYHHCLFFLHLGIEKMLKAVFVKLKNSTPPATHDLVRLAETAGLPTTEIRKLELAEISSFNVSARYDDYKKQFYAKATKEYAKKWLETGKTIFTELEAILQ